MIDYEKEFGKPDYAIGKKQTNALATTFKIVYGWMAAGLALSGLVAWYTFSSGLCQQILSGSGFTLCVVAELALVFILGMMIKKMPVLLAYFMFLLYAALNGLTLSVIFVAYELSSIGQVFFITAGMFGGLVVWGSVTRSDLSSIGSICGMALWGLIIAGIVNIFMKSSGLDWALSLLGIVVFTGLTMYDAQKIKAAASAEDQLDGATIHRIGILGALELYLDFVNLFLHILRFLGRRR